MSDTLQTLYKHQRHPHQPQNVNELHAEERRSGINARIALLVTRMVGTMQTAYLFMLLAGIGLCAILGLLTPLVVLLVAWLSQTFIQLVLLPIIMVGQNVQGRHTELLAEEQFNTTQKAYHDIEQVMKHLDAQDEKILQIVRHNELILKSLEQSRSRLVKSGARNAKRAEEESGITQEIEAVTSSLTKDDKSV